MSLLQPSRQGAALPNPTPHPQGGQCTQYLSPHGSKCEAQEELNCRGSKALSFFPSYMKSVRLWSSGGARIPLLQLNPLQATLALSLRTDCRLDGAVSTCQLLQHLLEQTHLGLDPRAA